MAITPMPSHEDGDVFPAADYMTLKENIEDLDTRLGPVVFPDDAHSRLSLLETLTEDASHGNLALDTRVDALEAASGGGGGPWVECPKISPWHNRAGGFVILSVRHLGNNLVQISGTVQKDSGSGGPGEDLANLPDSSFFPPGNTVVFCTDNGGNVRPVALEASGLIQLYIPSTATTTTTLTVNAIYYAGSGIPVTA